MELGLQENMLRSHIGHCYDSPASLQNGEKFKFKMILAAKRKITESWDLKKWIQNYEIDQIVENQLPSSYSLASAAIHPEIRCQESRRDTSVSEAKKF